MFAVGAHAQPTDKKKQQQKYYKIHKKQKTKKKKQNKKTPNLLACLDEGQNISRKKTPADSRSILIKNMNFFYIQETNFDKKNAFFRLIDLIILDIRNERFK